MPAMPSFAIIQFRRLVGACLLVAAVTFLNGFLGNILAGNLLGPAALAGVSLVGPIAFLLHFLSVLLGDGTVILYCQRQGAVDREGAVRVFVQGIWGVLLLGGLTAFLMVMGRETFLALMNPTAEIAQHARAYWNGIIPATVLMPASALLLGGCNADGDVQLCSASIFVQLAVNLLLTWGLLRAGYGAAACSLGVSAGALASCLVLLLHFLRSSNTFAFRWGWSSKDLGQLLFAALGDGSGIIGEAIIVFMLAWTVIARYGSEAMLGVAVFDLVVGLEALVNGFAGAMQPLVAVYFGERNVRSIGALMRHVTLVTVLTGVGVTLGLVIYPRCVLWALGLVGHPDTARLELIVRLVALGTVPCFLLNLANNYYQYIGREFYAIGGSVFGTIALPMVAMLLCPLVGDQGWFWVWWPISQWVAVGVFLSYCGARGRRQGCAGALMLDRQRLAKISVIDLSLEEDAIEAASVRVGLELARAGAGTVAEMRAQLMTEEVLMAVRERNAGRRVTAEVTLDLNDGVMLTLRDDGEIFDITDSDAQISSVRSFLVACMMEHQRDKANVLTTGFNRNVFKFKGDQDES